MRGPAGARGLGVSSDRGHWPPGVTAPVGLDCLCLLGPQSTMGAGPLGRVTESTTESTFFERRLLSVVHGDVAGRLQKSSPRRLRGQHTLAHGSDGRDSVLVRRDSPSLPWGCVPTGPRSPPGPWPPSSALPGPCRRGQSRTLGRGGPASCPHPSPHTRSALQALEGPCLHPKCD